MKNPRNPISELHSGIFQHWVKKIISDQHFRRKVSVEEQRAQKHDRFLRRRPLACTIYDHFRATGAYDAAQDLSDLFKFSRTEMTFKISTQDGIKLY